MDHQRPHPVVDTTDAGGRGGEVDAAAVGGGAHNVVDDIMDGMMKMFLHTTSEDNVLIFGWSTRPTWAAVLTCLLFAALAIVYEALKFVRERLDLHYAFITVKSLPTTIEVSKDRNSGTFQQPQPDIKILPIASASSLTFGAAITSWLYWLQAFLYMLQIALGYTLMLVFMYFNIWLCLSIVLGSGVGYLLFTWAKKIEISTDKVGDCC